MKYNITNLNNEKGIKVNIIEIENSNNYKVKFYTFGGYIHEIKIPKLSDLSSHEDVILGYENFEDLLISDGYFNSIIGRVCNRISYSKFELNKKIYKLFSNDNDHHLHGGLNGFNTKIWELDEIIKEKNSIICKLKYTSKNLEENYPGNLECKVTYELNNKNEFLIIYKAISDQDTIVNMTNHNYWNFHGHDIYYQNIIDHYVKIDSNYVCENDSDSIPNGNLIDVQNTKFDFTNYSLIEKKLLDEGGIDNNYSLININDSKPIAKVYSAKTGMGVEYSTDQPGIQFYTGNMMKEKYVGKYGKKYGKQYGICLETQNFPDAINKPKFPSPILKKGEAYKSFTKIKLRNDFI